MASGEETWCQGWSEPDAGSDLAAIRSRAVRDDAAGGWRLSGQKTWTTRGAFCDRMFGLFRTDPEAERHRGLTYFLVDLARRGRDRARLRPPRRRRGLRRGVPRGRVRARRRRARRGRRGLGRGDGDDRLRAGPDAAQPRAGSARRPSAWSSCTAHGGRPTPTRGCATTSSQAWIDAEAYRLQTLLDRHAPQRRRTPGPRVEPHEAVLVGARRAAARDRAAPARPGAELDGDAG